MNFVVFNNRTRGISTLALAALALALIGGTANAQDRPANAPATKLTYKQANQIALKKYPGKIAGKTPLENEEGKWQYGVMVRSGKTLREVMVNAMTGKIDNVEVTTEGKEAKEKAADAAKAKKGGKEENEGNGAKHKGK